MSILIPELFTSHTLELSIPMQIRHSQLVTAEQTQAPSKHLLSSCSALKRPGDCKESIKLYVRLCQGLQVFMLLLKRFKDDGDELNVAVPDLIRHLVSGTAPVPPANAPGLLRLHVVLQLPVGCMYLLQQLSPAAPLKPIRHQGYLAARCTHLCGDK